MYALTSPHLTLELTYTVHVPLLNFHCFAIHIFTASLIIYFYTHTCLSTYFYSSALHSHLDTFTAHRTAITMAGRKEQAVSLVGYHNVDLELIRKHRRHHRHHLKNNQQQD